jgi:isobutyryl-CoA dehydrogenase
VSIPASCSLGAAQASITAAINYTRTRRQFNQAIADFQWTQFRLAEMATKVVGARLLIRTAADALHHKRPETVALCSMAKLYGTDACFEVRATMCWPYPCVQVVNDALQMHGGYGVLYDYPVQQYLRDIRVHQIIEGTNEIMRLVIAKDLLAN